MSRAWDSVIAAARAAMEEEGWLVDSSSGLVGEIGVEATTPHRPVTFRFIGPERGDGPGFLRAEVGERSGSSRLWAVVTGAALEADASSSREMPAFQVSAGSGWQVAGVGLWVSRSAQADGEALARRFVQIVAELERGLAGAGAAAWDGIVPGSSIFAPSEAAMVKPSRVAAPSGVALIGGSIAATVAAFVVDPVLGLAAIKFTPATFLGGLLMLASHYRRQVAPKACRDVSRQLRRCALFDEHDRIRATRPLRPVVILEPQEWKRSLGAPIFRSGLLGARSSQHGISLKLGVQSLESADFILPACAIVPQAWTAVEVEGPPDLLARVPSHKRQELLPGRVCWLLDNDELQAGALSELLSALTLAVESREAGPYR